MKPSLVVLVLSVCLFPLCRTHGGEASLREDGASLVFGNEHLVLRFDRSTGIWTGLEAGDAVFFRREPVRPTVDVRIGDRNLFADKRPAVALRRPEVVRLQAASKLELTSALGDWEVTLDFTLWDDGRLKHGVSFAYSGAAPGKHTDVRNPILCLPPLAIPGDDAYWFGAAEYPPRDHPFRHTDPEREFRFPFSNSTFRSFLACSPERKLSLVTAYYSEDERVSMVIREKKHSAMVIRTHGAYESLRPGLRFRVGDMLLQVVHGDRQDALQALQNLYDLPGLRTQIGMPADTGRNIFYSAHPGGTIDSHFKDVGGFASFTKLLPSIRDLGVNTLWLLPFWYGPVYAPYDYFRLDSDRCGTPEELKALTDKAHSLGMRVLGDLIPHGPREERGVEPSFADQHGDLVCRDREGKMMQWWGCHYCDYANPGWQDYMARHAVYWVKECGLDGYRVDVAAGGAPNWRPYGDNRPSYSGLRGGLELMRKARAACLKENPKTLFLAESTGPSMYSAAEHGYHWAFSHLLEDHVLNDEPADFVQAMSGYLENQTYAFPADAFPIRFLTNHDKLRARYCYGPNLHRTLLALCAFMKGAPLLYHEQEIGNEDFIAKLYRIRQTYDELSIGTVSYQSIPVEPKHVFCIERELEGKRSVVLINFSNQASKAKLSLPNSGLKAPGIYEAVSGQRIDYARNLTQTLDPYAYAVLVIREKKELPAARPDGGGRPPASDQGQGEVEIVQDGSISRVSTALYRVVIDSSRGGLIQEARGADGELVVRGMELREGQRKLLVGCGPVDLANYNVPLKLVAKDRQFPDGRKISLLKGQVELQDRDGQAWMDLTVLWWFTIKELGVTVSLAPRRDLPPSKSDFGMKVHFAPTSHWFAETAEGHLLGRVIRRHAVPRRFLGRYWHGTGDTFFDGSLYAEPIAAESGVLDMDRGIAMGNRASRLDGTTIPVRLVEAEAPGAYAPGGPAAVSAEIPLLSGSRRVLWEKGNKIGMSVTLAFPSVPASSARLADTFGFQEFATGSTVPITHGGWRTFGPEYRYSGYGVRATVVRSHGAELTSLTDAAGDGIRVADARFYTDQGLFGEWHDPRGNARKMNATNINDPEPDTQLLHLFGGPQDSAPLRFRSFFRHPHAGGRSLLSPRIEYEIAYTPPGKSEEGLRIDCGVRPHMVKLNTKGFLAYKLSLKGCDQWRVGGGEWQSLPEKSARVWESKEVGDLPKALTLRDSKSGEWTAFSDFDAAQGQVQNVFLHAGQGQVHLFVAFYDAEPTDIRPVWRRAAFTMKAGGE